MKEQLIALLKLKPDVTDEQIVAAVAELKTANGLLSDENELLQQLNAEKPETDVQKLEKRIAKKIAESGGALNREQAVVAINHQDEALALAAKAKSAKKK